jgi:hypothetical protein
MVNVQFKSGSDAPASTTIGLLRTIVGLSAMMRSRKCLHVFTESSIKVKKRKAVQHRAATPPAIYPKESREQNACL